MRDLSYIFEDTDFVHYGGSDAEKKVAEYLKQQCLNLGVNAYIEPFSVAMADMAAAKVYADGKEVECRGLFGCGKGETEADFYYMPSIDPVSLALAKDKIVLVDTLSCNKFQYEDLIKAGVKGILFQMGNMYWQDNSDIEERDLRKAVVADQEKVLCAMLNVRQGVELVSNNTKRVKIVIDEEEYEGTSQNVIAEIPGKNGRWIVLSAHYDTTSHSHGAYDNMSGCAGLLQIMEALKDEPLNYGLRFIFCGSEERGLLGSKAYVKAHKEELENIDLDINIDMIGTIMGKFVAYASAEERLAGYLAYMGAELGFPIFSRVGLYSSDSTPFADGGVPAVTFARLAGNNFAAIHSRYDVKELLSMEQLNKDSEFILKFTLRMANSIVCPVSKEIPEKIKKQLDEYLYRTRKK